jgi:GNAT superfamily N-acetyltransferase
MRDLRRADGVEFRLPETRDELFSLCALAREVHENGHWSAVPFDLERAMLMALNWAGPRGLARTHPDKVHMVCAVRDGIVLGASAASLLPMQVGAGNMAFSEFFYVSRLWRGGTIGLHLARRAVEWAKTTDAATFLLPFSTEDNPKVDFLMRRVGALPVGRTYLAHLRSA